MFRIERHRPSIVCSNTWVSRNSPPSARDLEANIEANNHDWLLKYGIHNACKHTVGKLCATEATMGGGQVLTCLKAKRAFVTDGPCKTEVERYIKQGADNIKASPDTYDVCIEDVQTLCGQVRPGGGRVHACLLEHIASISAPCQQAEFQEQQLIQEDIRRSPQAYNACRSSLEMLCPASTAGLGARWKCLEDKKNDPGMAAACVAVVTANERLKNSNFHLNPNLATDCDVEAQRLCTAEVVLAEYKDFSSEGAVIGCLIAKRAQINDLRCKKSLLRKQKQRIDAIRNDPGASKDCASDIDKFCASVKEKGHGLVHTCLKEHHTDLEEPCQKITFDKERQRSENIELTPKLETDCAQEIAGVCKDVPKDPKFAVIGCLLDHMHDTATSPACRSSLLPEMRKRGEHLSFNPAMKAACKDDLANLIKAHAADSGSFCKAEGARLQCLLTHRMELKTPECKQEVRKAFRMQSDDMRAKHGMMFACKRDFETLCAGVHPGRGRGHKCLREREADIKSEQCRAMVRDTAKTESDDVTLNPIIRRKCQNEIRAFCAETSKGKGRVGVCLKLHEQEQGFGSSCKIALNGVKVDESLVKASLRGKSISFDEMHELIGRLGNTWANSHVAGAILLAMLATACIVYAALRNSSMYKYAAMVLDKMQPTQVGKWRE